jgi:hypothetical protein
LVAFGSSASSATFRVISPAFSVDVNAPDRVAWIRRMVVGPSGGGTAQRFGLTGRTRPRAIRRSSAAAGLGGVPLVLGDRCGTGRLPVPHDHR